MLISRKLTKDKRVVTDFRHLNTKIANNNLAYPLLKDVLLVLGSSKCAVSFRFKRWVQRNIVGYSLTLVVHPSYLYQRIPIGINISPSIWQSYINVILNCLQSKKYCEAIMDDLQLFTPSKSSHIRRFIKGIVEK